MLPMKSFLLIVLCLWLGMPLAQAQLFGTEGDSARTWKLRFWLDGGFKPLAFSARDAYSGEYLNQETARWEWRSWDSVDTRVTDFKKVNQVSLNVLLNVYRGLYLGFGYHTLVIRGFTFYAPGVYSTTNDALVALSGLLAYEWPIPGLPRVTLQPSVGVGRYQGSYYYTGLGEEWFGEARLGLAFRPLKRHSLRAWVAYGGYSYNEQVPSYLFEGDRVVKNDLRYLSAGLGLSFQLHIREEPVE
jgi:hypothetical protein